jgi:hypothetical protein
MLGACGQPLAEEGVFEEERMRVIRLLSWERVNVLLLRSSSPKRLARYSEASAERRRSRRGEKQC